MTSSISIIKLRCFCLPAFASVEPRLPFGPLDFGQNSSTSNSRLRHSPSSAGCPCSLALPPPPACPPPSPCEWPTSHQLASRFNSAAHRQDDDDDPTLDDTVAPPTSATNQAIIV
ncbi:unnamed protein product [Jaminaea pallidilutea]